MVFRTLCIVVLCILVVNAKSKWKKREDLKNKEKKKETKEKPFGEEKPIETDGFDQIIAVNSNLTEAELDGLFEGDIARTPKLDKYVYKKKKNPNSEDSPFDAISNGQWPNGKVPYVFSRGFRYSTVVQQAIREYNRKTCIRFVPRTNERNYINFMHGGGCYSMIGRQGGKQDVSLGNGCGTIGVAIHEMMHALGFFHEQSRRDRDNYITINFRNINRRMWYNFEKYRSGQASTLGEPYDKKSVMHYGNYAFSINGQKTIVSKANPNERLGQRSGLSRIDVNQLNKYYRCSVTGGKTTTTQRPPVPSGCKDAQVFCGLLANNKYCSNSWVKKNCKKSCKDSSCRSCVNKNNNCNAWAVRNVHCNGSKGCCTESRYSEFMKNNCAKACEFC